MNAGPGFRLAPMRGSRRMPSRKDFPFQTKLPHGSRFSENVRALDLAILKDCFRFQASTSKGLITGKTNQRLAQHICGMVLRPLQPCYGHTDRCRRQKRSPKCKHMPPPVNEPGLILISGRKGLSRGKSGGQRSWPKASLYRTRCSSHIESPSD